MIRPLPVIAAALAVGSLTFSATAALNDGFQIGNDPAAGEYTAGSIRSQEPDVPGYDPAIIWGGNSGNFLAEEGSLQSSITGYSFSGDGKVAVPGVSRPDPAGSDLTRYLTRNLNPVITHVAGETHYFSSLINRGTGMYNDVAAPISPDTFVLTGFFNAGNEPGRLVTGGPGTLYGLGWGFAANDTADGYDIVVRHRHREGGGSNPVIVANDVLLEDAAAEESYLVIFKATYNADSPNTGVGNDALQYWIGTEASGFDVTSEETLTDTAVAHGVLASFGFDLGTTGTINRAAFYQNLFQAEPAYFDELRHGTTLSAVIPEPTSLAVLGLGGLALLRRRRA